jgi:uncharacterized membrane protein YcfT
MIAILTNKFHEGAKMLKIILALATFACGLMISLPVLAEDHTHTENVCSAKNADLCSHLGLHNVLKTTEAGRFIVDIMTPDGSPATNLKVTLWMPDMGHGSSPVAIKDVGNNHFLVTEAWFVMTGKWLVKLEFDFAGETHQIEIPVDIAE